MPKPDIHIEDFIKDVGKTLVILYNAFPIKRAIYIDDICGERIYDEFGLLSNRHNQCLGSLIWLNEEGYIRFEHVLQFEGVEQAVLTQQSYALLHNYHIASSQLTIDRIRDALAEKDSEALKAAVHGFLVESAPNAI